MEKPKAVLFDAYGTLFDVYSVGLLAEQLFPGHGNALGVLWRDKQIEYTRLVTTSNHGEHYQPFWDLTRAGLRYACKRLALALTPAREERLMNQYRHLSAFPENKEVLSALKAKGVATGILSNGDPQMLGVAVRSAGLEGLLDHVLSVDSVRKYKTHPDAYALGPAGDRPGCQADRRSSAATPGTRWPRPGSAIERCGSTATNCRSRSWARSPRAPAPACATSSPFSESTHLPGEKS